VQVKERVPLPVLQLKVQPLPDKTGHFGIFGGKYAPETLMPALDELEKEYYKAQKDPGFQKSWRIISRSM